MSAFGWGFVVERNGCGYVVYLGHECGRWAIAGEHGGYTGVTQAAALDDLDTFITEAQAARTALAEGREFGNGAAI